MNEEEMEMVEEMMKKKMMMEMAEMMMVHMEYKVGINTNIMYLKHILV
jgi:hypothetical protein